ncbi:PIN domain-containing protein [Kibdelosporangium aridum]|uniref:Ribonuclease VapC n=1 Tax=Kibdelosporangium aridum TaxID=2030 RepID=A0A428YNK6_KIBAR|nr:type II toxin-antitoxin system VapC family toxin [Kibdelosporangium aridum]RSM69845.1 PIN domain-containing protein [Kibdelosporangium aridum]
MIYLDSCAIIKLIAQEPESGALADWIEDHARADLVTSMLSEVEVPRALRRGHPQLLGAVTGVLKRLYRIEINDEVRATAAAYLEPNLRSLDAIHLATADAVAALGKNVEAFVTYDKRLAEAAARSGHTVVAPGE